MNRVFVWFSLAGVFVLCGCGPRYWWDKPGVSDAQIRQDCRDCMRQAEAEQFAMDYEEWKDAKSTGRPYWDYHDDIYWDSDYNYDRPMFKRNIDIRKCMENKGYTRVFK